MTGNIQRGFALSLGALALLAATALAAPNTINYQGELKKDNVPFNGVAKMKFALVSITGDPHRPVSTTWSNDSTSSAGAEPTASVDVPVSNGVFSVMLGAAPMRPLSNKVFPNDLRLRVWVNTGGSGFELLVQDLAGVPFAFTSGDSTNWVGGSGADIYRPSGRVGIGTMTPQAPLHLATSGGSWGSPRLLIENTGAGDQVAFGFKALNTPVPYDWEFAGIGASGVLRVRDVQTGIDKLRINPGLTGSIDLLPYGGTVSVPVLEITGGDLTEPFVVVGDERPAPGTVLSIVDGKPGQLSVSNRAYDTRVAGVVSGAGGVNAGIRMYRAGLADATVEVALSGRVWCLADASLGRIRAGDLLTSSPTPGYAMAATDLHRRPGSVIGKAMSSLDQGLGVVLILVNLQ